MCTLRHSLETGEQCSAAELAAALQRRGYAARLCKSEGGGSGTAAFRNLRHTFLRVEAGSADAWWAQPAQQAGCSDAASEDEAASGEMLVDCHFACQFVVANPTPRFAALLSLLPQTFVGSAEQLEHVVEWVCREMEHSFKQRGQPLPPWRETGAMLTKWRPQRTPLRDAAVGASPPGSPPAPCCCGGAGIAGNCGGLGAADLQQAAALLACCTSNGSAARSPGASSGASSGAPTTPTAIPSGPRASLLSRSLERAGLRRKPSLQHQGTSPAWGGAANWHEPRTVVVRRST
ncbi:Translation initiation factor IF-3 [Chlorella sorokiniana]|jgi:uncharacterized protein (TIGR01615 family)|uniref:Translation initiation factor IF-3 n=1 Tax=Chlorella sorokiniana TaxID=3076 RepID=A0A2P6TBP0_CHLSO|nr:Translation initiation factor IF-3 [Chlorella sorokiniana]|eukprot:PRW18304.1 Translation initiation factor IF-3 [Chlorella sorokiniana]